MGRQLRIGFIACMCALSIGAFAYEDEVKRILHNTLQLGGDPEVVEELGRYTRIILPDSVTVELYKADSIVVVMTACAPQCSSCARVYNKEWNLIRTITPPFASVFPLATMDKKTGRIIWTDNDGWEY